MKQKKKTKFKLYRLNANSLSVNWNKVEAIRIETIEEWNELIRYLKANGVKATSKTRTLDWIKDNTYRLDDRNVLRNATYVYVGNYNRTPYNKYDWIKFYYSESEVTAACKGYEALEETNSMFKEQFGLSLIKAFGTVSVDEFRYFNYAPMIYTPNEFKGYKARNIVKADISSAYPFQLTKKLPDSHTAIKRNGRIKPDAEYEFAYYLKSNQLAIYGEFDTHDYVDCEYNKSFNNFDNKVYKRGFNNRLYYKPVEDKDEITILMKRSKYSLKEIEEEIYHNKEIAKDELEKNYWKGVGVCFVGAIASEDKNCGFPMRHISSIVYARCLIRMFELAKQLEENGCTILSFATDSIIWSSKANYKAITQQDKYLGCFHLEYEKARCYIAAQGNYCIEDNGKIVVVKHQGTSKEIFDKAEINTLEDYINNSNIKQKKNEMITSGLRYNGGVGSPTEGEFIYV